MDESLQSPVPVEEVPQVVEVVDAQAVMGDYVQSTNDRLVQIDEKIDTLSLTVQSENGNSDAVLIEETQWQEMIDEVQTINDSASLSLFLTLLLLCVISAILGTRLFSVFAEGWRH
jgi:hypothetical protein